MDNLELVRQIMARHSLTMADLSRVYGIPYRTLQDWFAGRRRPPEYVLILLGDSLCYRYDV